MNIPKKLEFRPHLTTGVIARDRDMEMLVLWLNELRDYLQAKEEASKGECPMCGNKDYKNGCSNCYERMFPEDRVDRITNKEVAKPNSSEHEYCWKHGVVGVKYGENGCKHVPPEHEEELVKLEKDYIDSFGDLFHTWSSYGWWIKYIRDNFVSKEKIKREGKQILRTLSMLELDWKGTKITEDEKLAFGLARDRAWTIVEGFIAGLGD